MTNEERKAAAKAAIRESLQTMTDYRGFPKTQLDGMQNILHNLIDADDISAINATLAAQNSGPITIDDMAFAACVHRASVTDNGAARSAMKGTSPFKRITEASRALMKRATPLDNRQIRTILTVLGGLGFTTEVAPAIHGWKDKSQNRAAIWTLSRDPLWLAPFEPPKPPPPPKPAAAASPAPAETQEIDF